MKMIKKIYYEGYNNVVFEGSVQIVESSKSIKYHNPSSHEDETKNVFVCHVIGYIASNEKFREEFIEENRIVVTASMMEDKVKNELKRIAHPNPEKSFAGALRERGYSITL